VALVGLAFLTLVFLLTRSGSGNNGGNYGGSGSGGGGLKGQPAVVLVTVLDASKYGPGYLETVKRNREAYAEMHGK
jgi:hypothetical protein